MFSSSFLNKKEIINAAMMSFKSYSDTDNSPAVYTDSEGINFEKKQYFDVNNTEGVVYCDATSQTMYLAFRGTSGINDVLIDSNILGREFMGYKAHKGFVKAYEDVYNTVESIIHDILECDSNILRVKKLIITGHSLGGALAQLAFVHIKSKFRSSLDALGVSCVVVSFGSPKLFCARSVDDALRNLFLESVLRITHSDDVVPTLPKYSSFMKKVFKLEYVHVGQHCSIGEQDDDHSFKEHRITKYVECLNTTDFYEGGS